MANLDTHFNDQPGSRGARKRFRRGGGKWSGRTSIAFALVASSALWALIFLTAKAMIA
jgi:hypothetical protein